MPPNTPDNREARESLVASAHSDIKRIESQEKTIDQLFEDDED